MVVWTPASYTVSVGQGRGDTEYVGLSLGEAYQRIAHALLEAERDILPDWLDVDIRLTTDVGRLVHHVWLADGIVRQWSDHRHALRRLSS